MTREMRNQVVTHGQKVRDMVWMVESTFRRMGIKSLVYRWLLRSQQLSSIWNLVNRMCSLWVARSRDQTITYTAEDVIKSKSLCVIRRIGTSCPNVKAC